MVIDAFKEVGGLASTDVTPEGFLFDVKHSPSHQWTNDRLEHTLYFRITSILTMR
jgi:hypothetical protein